MPTVKQTSAVLATCLLLFVMLVAPQQALADRTAATTMFHSALTAVTGANQIIQTTTMQQRSCVGWLFQNQSGAQTVYLNVNANATLAVVGSYDDQLVLGPGEWRELDTHNIDRFQVIGSGAANLYWSCICHSS